MLVDSDFANLMSDLERISDVCSNVGVATVARVDYERASQAHSYISTLHQGDDEEFNKAYSEAHSKYFAMLDAADEIQNNDDNEVHDKNGGT